MIIIYRIFFFARTYVYFFVFFHLIFEGVFVLGDTQNW